jgi:hypothetical protein
MYKFEAFVNDLLAKTIEKKISFLDFSIFSQNLTIFFTVGKTLKKN